MDLVKNLITNKAKEKFKELGLSNKLISIFLKQKKYRTSEDSLYLTHSYEHFECFQKILKNNKEGELMLDTIFKKLDFVLYDPGKIIYSCNDIISNMFYIFYGYVKVDTNKNNTLSRLNSPKKRKNQKKSKNKNKLPVINERKDFLKLGFVLKLIDGMKKNLIKKETEFSYKDFKENEIILSKGEEYGLDEINENRRKYTVEAKSSCLIGFLSKEDWQYIFQKTNIIKKNDIIRFLEGLRIFKNRKNDKIIDNMYDSITEKFINIGETLINYGEEIKKFYIIRKGYFQVEVKMKSTIRNEFNDICSFGNYNDREKTENIKYEAKNYYTKEDNFRIITYGKGEFLGAIEYYLDSKRYLSKISCKSSSSVVYEIKYEDLMTHMTPSLKETLINEGKEKSVYFRKRINEMRLMKSSKFNNKNKYKQIILNKLEEEKGSIFDEMENKRSGLYLYELNRRKRLKTASFKKTFKDICENNDFIKNKYEYNRYLNKMKQTRNRIKSNYLSIFNNRGKKENNFNSMEKHIFPTSVKNNKTNIKLFNKNFKHYNENKINRYYNSNKDSPSKLLDTIFTNSLTPTNKEKQIPLKSDKISSISTFFNSIPNKTINMNNIEIKNKMGKKNLKTMKTINIGFSPKSDFIKILLNKRYIPKTPNDKILKAYSYLCNTESNGKNNLKTNESIGINYYNTQDYSFLRTSDKSSNDNESNTNSNLNNIYILKKDKKNNNFNLKRTIPLLTEIVKNKKELKLKGLYSKKYNNYNVKY